MSEYPDDIMRKAADSLLAAGHAVRIGDDAHCALAEALRSERQRCAAIAEAVRDDQNKGDGFDSQPVYSAASAILRGINKGGAA